MRAQSIEFLARLVGAASVSSGDPVIDCSNAEASAVVAQMLADAGMQVVEEPVPGLEGKYNVVAHAGPEQPGEGLLLAGHTDTVPCDMERWGSDPFRLVERDGNLHGLGACDMKGFFAVVAEALATIDLNKLRQPLRVWATANEECGMQGAMHLAQAGAPSRHALVGEPTGLVPVHAHKGAFADEIILIGKSAHASIPDQGRDPIEAAARIMTALRADFDSLGLTDSEFDPPCPTLTFGHVMGGDAFNRIAENCKLWVDRRLLPVEGAQEVRQRMRDLVIAIADEMGTPVAFKELVGHVPPMRTDPAKPVVEAAVRLSGQQARTVSYGTEAPFYAAAGMDVVVMGAGDIAVAHQPDEHVPVAQLEGMARIVTGLVKELGLLDD